MAVRPIDGEALWDKLEDALWYDNYDRDMAEKIVVEIVGSTYNGRRQF